MPPRQLRNLNLRDRAGAARVMVVRTIAAEEVAAEAATMEDEATHLSGSA